MQTQKQDIQNQIRQLEMMLHRATTKEDTENQKLFENKIFWLKSTLTHIQ